MLREHQAVVPGAPSTVFQALERQLTPAAPDEVNFLADPDSRLIVLQGGWWYRGEYRVEGDPAGSRISFTLVNVAPTAHWAGPIAGRAVVRDSARAFEELVSSIS